MRIISGKFRGTKLYTPSTSDIRPTADKTRQALFNILTHRLKIELEGKRIADICAGSGALGFEALSHGAASCHFYDHASLDLVKQNAEKLRVLDKITLVKAEAAKLPKAPHAFDIIFIDPPYNQGWCEKILSQLEAQKYLEVETVIVCEEDKNAKIEIPLPFELIERRVYGKAQILISRPNKIDKI